MTLQREIAGFRAAVVWSRPMIERRHAGVSLLDRPVLVLNLPGNLGLLVDRGVALGVRRGESIAKALEALLFDPETARRLETKRMEYIREFAFGADGRSTERIVECILNEIDGGKSGKP